ncbi:15975_t:CDS:2, partial [Racocetra persica]
TSQYLPGQRSVGDLMLLSLSEEYDSKKDTINTLYYIKKFSSFIQSRSSGKKQEFNEEDLDDQSQSDSLSRS